MVAGNAATLKRLRPRAGEEIGLDRLLIATGAHIRTLAAPGRRSIAFCSCARRTTRKRIRAHAAGARRAVVIGAGFIGMAVASVLAQQEIETTIPFRGDVAGGNFSAWWLRGGRLVAAFVMNRPEEEREAAPVWIAAGRRLALDGLCDERTPLAAVAT